MEKGSTPVQTREGGVYGTIVYWILVIGVITSIVGLVIYQSSDSASCLDKTSLLDYLWLGRDCQNIWMGLGGINLPLSWNSILGMLSKGDIIAMLGINICAMAAVIGMWGAAIQTACHRGRLHMVFALIIAIVLTLSALGVVQLEM